VEFPHTSPSATLYKTSNVSDQEDWGEIHCIPSPEIREYPGVHWGTYDPLKHSNYILIPTRPRGNNAFEPIHYISFQTNYLTGELEILGINGTEYRVHMELLTAQKSHGPMLADNTNLKHFKEWCFADAAWCRALQELGSNGVLVEVVQVQ
jgi:hypothetical protein